MEIDLIYLCKTIGNLSGIPIRIYNDKKMTFYYSLVDLPKDPIAIYENEIFKITDHIGYFATEHFYYYGIVNYGKIKIVIGPTRQIPDVEQELREMAFQADIDTADTDSFIINMKSILHMPLESILQMLCTVNYVLNGEKKTLEDISIYDSEQESYNRYIADLQDSPDPAYDSFNPHNTYDTEQKLMYMIEHGDYTALKEWLANAPALRSGILAADQLRQIKNTFIVSSTLASRAAIRGGMAIEDAMQLSDAYIQKCEILNSPDRIINLQYHMVLDFTEQVNAIRGGIYTSKLTIEVSNYILHHLSDSITTDAIAKELFVSRSHLSHTFKAETGVALSDFIMQKKIEEAKKLLRYSTKSLSAISTYLGFSSQSHFSRVFKKYVGENPRVYRNKLD
ncbi:MAG: helix-turn-helix domain-containing protein [Lachnobacterium sp.]|nr:helix-turn-helix domain-containing protein [Lachnobacterium sp.]